MDIQQAIFTRPDGGGVRLVVRSAGFGDAWLGEAERLCLAFGERRAEVSCTLAVFAQPFARKFVAIVQASDQGANGAMIYRLLILPRPLYLDLASDPFWISDQLPPVWSASELEVLTWTAGPPPRRQVGELRKVLDVEAERTQMLLGGTQILVDGGRLVFQRPQPDDRTLRDLWALLPYSTRQALWPATFAFGSPQHFHVLVTPDATGPEYERYTPGEQAGDYPEGTYEYALQKAIEDGDQGELDGLLARRSRSQTMKLAIGLLLAFSLAALIINFPFGARPADNGKQAAKEEKLSLPPAEQIPSLGAAERKPMAARLKALNERLGAKPPEGDDEPALAAALVALDRSIDEKLGEKKPKRDPGSLEKLGPAKRRLMALLWKHGVSGYDQPEGNADEMLARLAQHLARAGIAKEGGGE